jgi:hypothetical protein
MFAHPTDDLRLHLLAVVKFAMTFPTDPEKVSHALIENPFIR